MIILSLILIFVFIIATRQPFLGCVTPFENNL